MKTFAVLLASIIAFMLTLSDQQSLIIKVQYIGVSSLGLSWEYSREWFWFRMRCLGDDITHTPHNCSSGLFHRNAYKPLTVYALVPTYIYRFEVAVMQENPEEIIISNTTGLITMGISPIKINEIEILETEKAIRVHYTFDPAGLWYGYVEMIVVSHPQTTKTSKKMLVNEVCKDPECNGAFVFIIQSGLFPGYTYIITAYASKYVRNDLRVSGHQIRNHTIPPRNIRRLEAKATMTPRQIELNWLWPTQGIWTDYTIGCEVLTLHEGICSYKRFSFIQSKHGSKKQEDFKYLIGNLFGGAKYRFFVELESLGIPSKRKSYVDTVVAPDSVTGLKLERGDGIFRLKWKWPKKSSWTHYSVKCSMSSSEEVSCQKTLYPLKPSEVDQNTEYEHIVNSSNLLKVYRFEVNVESYGVPAIYPAEIEVESQGHGYRKRLNTGEIILIILIVLAFLASMAISVSYVVKRKKNKISHLSGARLAEKRTGRRLSNSSKGSYTIISVPGSEHGSSPLKKKRNLSQLSEARLTEKRTGRRLSNSTKGSYTIRSEQGSEHESYPRRKKRKISQSAEARLKEKRTGRRLSNSSNDSYTIRSVQVLNLLDQLLTLNQLQETLTGVGDNPLKARKRSDAK